MNNLFEQHKNDESDFLDAISYFDSLYQIERNLSASEQPSQDNYFDKNSINQMSTYIH